MNSAPEPTEALTCRMLSTYTVPTGSLFVSHMSLSSQQKFKCCVAITHNDQHAGGAGNFSPDLPGPGQVDIYWYVFYLTSYLLEPWGWRYISGDSYPQGANRWATVQTIYWSNHVAVAPNNPLCLAEVGNLTRKCEGVSSSSFIFSALVWWRFPSGLG